MAPNCIVLPLLLEDTVGLVPADFSGLNLGFDGSSPSSPVQHFSPRNLSMIISTMEADRIA